LVYTLGIDHRGRSPTASRSNPKPPTPPAEPQVTTAKLFRNGRSQAVRLPKEFRFEGTEVAIRRDPASGDIILSELAPGAARSMKDWFAVFDSLDIPDDIFKREVHMPEERDIFE
jgi:antitoxin VapB